MIYQDEYIRVEIEPFQVPWVKIFARKKCKEMSDCDQTTKQRIYEAVELTEEVMRAYFKPDKINIASFGNMVPQVHWHVQARFKNDSFFPNPVWGEKVREGSVDLPPLEQFIEILQKRLKES